MSRKNNEKKQRFTWLRAAFADRAKVLHTLTSIVTAAIVVTVIATMVIGRGPLLARASELRGSKFSVAFDWPPLAGKSTSRSARTDQEAATWLNREQRADLENLALKLLNGDPFDGTSLERTRNALRETGWFADGPWLKRHENGVVVISGKWRVPVAAVRTGETDRLVASQGEMLVAEYPRGRSGMKVVVGGGAPPAALGEKWPGGSAQAGIELLNFLRPVPGYDQVMAVDVSDFAEDKKLSILTTTGGRVLWGGSLDQFHPGQASSSAKRERLAMVYQRFGQLDAGRTVVDVRPEDGVYLQDDGYIARNTTVHK